MHDLLPSLVGFFSFLIELWDVRVRQLMRKRSEYYIFYELGKDTCNSAVAQPPEEKKTQTKGWILSSVEAG